MANILNRIAGTTELSFKIGLGGFTLYSGTTDPSITPPTPSAFGFQDGDLYVRTVSGLISIYAYDTGAWSILTGGVAVSSVFSRTGAVVAVAGDYTAAEVTNVPAGTISATDVQGAIDVAAETERLQKEYARIREQMEKIEKKLNSSEFMSRAPEKIISENKSRHEELQERCMKIQSNLKNLPVQ